MTSKVYCGLRYREHTILPGKYAHGSLAIYNLQRRKFLHKKIWPQLVWALGEQHTREIEKKYDSYRLNRIFTAMDNEPVALPESQT